jgi:hypothetical protein
MKKKIFSFFILVIHNVSYFICWQHYDRTRGVDGWVRPSEPKEKKTNENEKHLFL